MSSLQKTNSGHRIQFRLHGKTRQITLPGCKKKAAESIQRHVDELLACRHSGESPHGVTRVWLEQISDELRASLVELHLCAAETKCRSTMIELFDEFLSRRNIEESTRLSYLQTREKLCAFFGNRTPDSVTRGCVDDFCGFLSGTLNLADNTVRKRCSQASTFFRWLCRRELLDRNPWDDVPKSVGHAKADKPFIPAVDIDEIIKETNDPEWKLLIALGRWGGLRVPSEAFGLQRNHVNWKMNRMRIYAPKTDTVRVIPVFPELRPFLKPMWSAEHSDEWLLPRLRSGSGNVRTQFERLIRRAGLKQWPNLWNTLRSTRETELAQIHPLHVVCEWIGNSPAVAQRHYLKPTDEDFARAVRAENAPKQISTDSHHDTPQDTSRTDQ